MVKKPAGQLKRPGRSRLDIDAERVMGLYRGKKMSVRKVAGHLGVSPATVRRRIVENNGQLRGWRLPGEE